jgi:glycosyltransferase involved in cell wall biosynthesis
VLPVTVLHCITGLFAGGAERQLLSLLQGGEGDASDVHVLSLMDEGMIGGRIRQLGVPVHSLHMRRGIGSLSALIRYRRLLREIRPDVIQGWMYHGNLFAWLGRVLSHGSPGVAWNIRASMYDLEHNKWMSRWVIRANRRLSSRVNAIVYNSAVSRGQHEAFGFKVERGIMIPNGFDLNRLRPDQSRGSKIRTELGIPKDAMVVGHVARLHPMKDHGTFIRAAVQVARTLPQVHVVLIGKGVDTSAVDLIDTVPREMRPRFHFLGERNDVPSLIQMMDLLCQSSSWGEAFPNVLGEAMATGVPCVSTNVGDSAAIVGDVGLIVPPGNAVELASAIVQTLGMPDAKRDLLGAKARERVEQLYDIQSVVARYRELHESLTNR